MTVDREFLEATVRNLRTQKENAVAAVNQCDGALQICEVLMKRLDAPEEPAMTMDELQQAINRGAANGESE